MTSKTDDEMAKYFRDKQAEIDSAWIAMQTHLNYHPYNPYCKTCKQLKDELWQARYYGD